MAMAADLFLASLEARSLSFPCCKQNQLLTRLTGSPSHALLLSAATKPCTRRSLNSRFLSKCSKSASKDFGILSVTECSDGSIIFRFGDVTEMAMHKAESSQASNESDNTVVQVGGRDLDKEETSVNAVDVSDGEGEAVGDSFNKKVGPKDFYMEEMNESNAVDVSNAESEKARESVSTKVGGKESVVNAIDVSDREGKQVGESVSKKIGGKERSLNAMDVSDGEGKQVGESVSKKIGGKDLEEEEMSVVNSVDVSDGEGKEAVESVSNSVDVSDGEGKEAAESVSKKVGRPSKSKSQSKRKPRPITTRVADLSVKEKAQTVSMTDKETGKFSVDSYHHIDPKEGSGEIDSVVIENNSAPKGNGESTTLNMGSKTDLVPDADEVSLPLEAFVVRSKSSTPLVTSESDSRIEVPHSVKSQDENSGASEEIIEKVGKIEGSALNVVSNMDLFADVKKDSPPSTASESGSKTEVPHSDSSHEKKTGPFERVGEKVCGISKTEIEEVSPSSAASVTGNETTSPSPASESGSKIEVPHGDSFEDEKAGLSERLGKKARNISRMEIDEVSLPLEASSVESEMTSQLASLESSSKTEMVKEEISNASDVKDANSGSRMDLALKEVHAQVAASENSSIESETTIQSTSSGACSESADLPHNLKLQEIGNGDAGKEVADLSVSSEENNINVSNKSVMVENANEIHTEVNLDSYMSEAEAILNEETFHKTVDEFVDNDTVKSPKLSGDDLPLSSFKDDISESDSQSVNKVRVPMLKGVEFQSAGTTLEREENSAAGFFLYSGAALSPNPTKAFAGGEDAYFIASQNWLGVADGVGQWSLEGISVGLYAKELMENCQKVLSDRNGIPITDPVEVIKRGAANTQSCGSSTALVACFDDRALHVANIGDSGFMIIRNGAVFRRSSPMVYEFSFPLRIERGDDPSDLLEIYSIDLNEGDVIVTATNGLFDNLYEQEIASVIVKSLHKSSRPQEIAELLAKRAQEVGQLPSVRSPFADKAQAAGYVAYRGGKLDDVTVIVSLVKRRFGNHVQ